MSSIVTLPEMSRSASLLLEGQNMLGEETETTLIGSISDARIQWEGNRFLDACLPVSLNLRVATQTGKERQKSFISIE